MVCKTFCADISHDLAHKVTALVNAATGCKSQVLVSAEEKQIPADSVLGLLTLFNGSKKQTFTVSAAGADEQEVMEKISMIFNSA